MRKARPRQGDLFGFGGISEAPVELPLATEAEEIREDYEATGFTLRRHPLALLRPRLKAERCVTTEEMRLSRNGRPARLVGIVTLRQRPGTARGTMFVTLEDETGLGNVIVWPAVYEAHRIATLNASLLQVTGRIQRQGIVVNLVASVLVDASELLSDFRLVSRDFR